MADAKTIDSFLQSPRIGGAYLSLILHALQKRDVAMKVEFDQRVKNRRLELLNEIATLDEASKMGANGLERRPETTSIINPGA